MPKVKELDFFRMKLQHMKPAAFYVREGKAFYYVGPDRFDIEGSVVSAVNLGVKSLDDDFDYDEEFKEIPLSDDLRLTGHMRLLQDDGAFLLVFIEKDRSHPPIVIRCGQALDHL